MPILAHPQSPLQVDAERKGGEHCSRNARRPRCQALFSGSISGNTGPMFPRSLGTAVMMTAAPDFPCRLSPAH